jgi:hypothetical protein
MCRKREHIPHLSESSSTLVDRYDTNELAEEKKGENTRLASARSHVSIIRPMTCHICMFCWVEQYSLDLAESFPLRMCPIIAPRTPSHRWFPSSIHFFSVVPGVEVVRGFYRPLVACWLVFQHALWKRLSAFYPHFVGWSRHLQYFPETLNSGRIPLWVSELRERPTTELTCEQWRPAIPRERREHFEVYCWADSDRSSLSRQAPHCSVEGRFEQ